MVYGTAQGKKNHILGHMGTIIQSAFHPQKNKKLIKENYLGLSKTWMTARTV